MIKNLLILALMAICFFANPILGGIAFLILLGMWLGGGSTSNEK